MWCRLRPVPVRQQQLTDINNPSIYLASAVVDWCGGLHAKFGTQTGPRTSALEHGLLSHLRKRNRTVPSLVPCVAGDHTAHQSFHAHSAHRLREVAQAEPEQLRTLNRMAMMIKRKLQTADEDPSGDPGFINDPKLTCVLQTSPNDLLKPRFCELKLKFEFERKVIGTSLITGCVRVGSLHHLVCDVAGLPQACCAHPT